MSKVLLKRLGNKDRLSDKIISVFPEHTNYIELFFGAGGIFFNKPKVRYNIINDMDEEVYNFFIVLRDHKKEFYEFVLYTPISDKCFYDWKYNKETDPVRKAYRFLYLSVFGLYGLPKTFRLDFTTSNFKANILKRINHTHFFLNDVVIYNSDYRLLLKSMVSESFNKNTFIYADPPYINTSVDQYNCGKWIEKDLDELLSILIETGCKFAVSEFRSDILDKLILKYKLNSYIVEDRRSINSKENRYEILITNYK